MPSTLPQIRRCFGPMLFLLCALTGVQAGLCHAAPVMADRAGGLQGPALAAAGGRPAIEPLQHPVVLPQRDWAPQGAAQGRRAERLPRFQLAALLSGFSVSEPQEGTLVLAGLGTLALMAFRSRTSTPAIRRRT